MDILIENYIYEQVKRLISSNKCCMQWFAPFSPYQQIVVQKIPNCGLENELQIINGHRVNRIYKMNACNHCLTQPTSFLLTERSQRDILIYLKNFGKVGICQEEILPHMFKTVRQKAIPPPNHFTIGPPGKNIHICNFISKQMLQQSSKIFPYHAVILQKLNSNRVLVINGDAGLEKSTAVPLFIVENSAAMGSYAKILCVELDNLSAITHCSVLSKCIQERVGSRVGFQVYLQSRVCDNTNLIYTTAVYLLRVLMGQQSKDAFQRISHIVVADVHLHDACIDIVLHELRNILPHYPEIKIILLSDSTDNSQILSYFGEGNELRLDIDPYDVTLYYIEEIRLITERDQNRQTSTLIKDHNVPIVDRMDNVNLKWIDMALEEYEVTGSDIALNRFLYLVNVHNVAINVAHTKFGYTALTTAAKQDKTLHLNRLLTYENTNPLSQDINKFNAHDYVTSNNNIGCARALLDFMEEGVLKHKPPPIDFCLLTKLVQLITTTFEFGHILIFLSTHEDLLHLRYNILKAQFIGRLPQGISIHLLHKDMQYDQLHPIIAHSTSTKIILATKLAESLAYLNDITYVIDSSQDCIEKYNTETKCKEPTSEWASKETIQRRSMIARRFVAGHCFRLFPRNLLNKLPSQAPPEILYMPMDRISLMVKLLCPEKMVTEYLQHAIITPPVEHVHDSIEFLKKIEVFDCSEDATWLGCRLIDLPIDLELGKSLVLSIILKCLDPLLTIVSFLTCTESRTVEKCKRYAATANLLYEREKIMFRDDGSFSDHLTLLRLYQAWQNDRRGNTSNDVLINEDTYVISGVLDKVCGVRTHLVGALRSCLLIHNQGQLSMHSINSNANNWAVVKAALTCGLYPKICIIDKSDGHLKSSKFHELCISRSSLLRDSKTGTVNHRTDYPSDWVAFFRETNCAQVNIISDCTVISPVTIALFAGKSGVDPDNILFPEIPKSLVNCRCTTFYIDDWICVKTDINSALLIFKMRQMFYATYLDFLQTCGNNDKWRKSSTFANSISSFIELLSKILLEEDVSAGFRQPNCVGIRPKAVVNNFIFDFHNGFQPKPISSPSVESFSSRRCLDKNFFLLNIFNSDEIMKSFPKQQLFDISKDAIFELICAKSSPQKLTYVIVCNLNRKLLNVSVVEFIGGRYFLRRSFQRNITVYDVIIMCATNKLTIPTFRPDLRVLKLDNAIGEIILDLL